MKIKATFYLVDGSIIGQEYIYCGMIRKKRDDILVNLNLNGNDFFALNNFIINKNQIKFVEFKETE